MKHSLIALSFLTIARCSDSQEGAAPKKHEPQVTRPENVQPAIAPFAAFDCPNGAAPASALALAQEATYVEVRQVAAQLDQVLIERGTPCIDAVSPEQCKSNVKKQHQALAGGNFPHLYALTTVRDKVEVWSGEERLRKLFGAVDTPSEAWILTMETQHADPYVCGEILFSAHRKVQDGYELKTRRYTKRCRPLEQTDYVYRVGSGGEVKLVSNEIATSDSEACVAD